MTPTGFFSLLTQTQVYAPIRVGLWRLFSLTHTGQQKDATQTSGVTQQSRIRRTAERTPTLMDGGELEDSFAVMEVWSSSETEEEEEERTTSSFGEEMLVEERAYRNSNINQNKNKESLCREVSQGE